MSFEPWFSGRGGIAESAQSPRVRRAGFPLFLVVLAGCQPETVALPQADDPVFARLANVRLGMGQTELIKQRPSIEVSPEGELWEPFGSGWITYGFRPDGEFPLTSIRVWMEFADSLSLRERWEGLVASLTSAVGFDPECYRNASPHLDEIRVLWRGRPNAGVSSQLVASPDGVGYRAELVVLVGDSELPLHPGSVPCNVPLSTGDAP